MRHRSVLIACGILTLVLASTAARLWWPSPASGAQRAAESTALSAATPGSSRSTAEPSRSAGSSPDIGSSAAGSSEGSAKPSSVPATDAPGEQTLTVGAAERALTNSLDTLLGPASSFSAAGLDLTTGRSITVGANSGMSEASLIKLDILQTLLYQADQQGSPLDSQQAADATAMMEHSDNAAADRVFVDVGGNSGLTAYNQKLGLTMTALNPDGTWGLSTTSAGDQLRLLQAIVSTTSPLSAKSRAYALSLMSNVESDQDWGVSAAADHGTTTALKNGWLNIDSDDGKWAVNSAGIVTVDGRQLLLVVLSQYQPDYQTGVDRVQAAAVQLATAVS